MPLPIIRVRACPGKSVPFHPNTITAPGAQVLVLASGQEADVPHDMLVRRRIAAGDLEVVPPPVNATTKPKEQ